MDIVERVLWDSSYDTRQEAADEIERLRENAKQDAKFLSAYHRICQKHGIAPSSADLIAAMEECGKSPKQQEVSDE